MSEGISKRGAAAMSPENRTIVARKGGLSTSKDKAHMAAIGRKGALSCYAKHGREHFSRIGKKGGAAPRKPKVLK